MAFPDFFDSVPGIVLRDPLADLLAAADGGVIEYRYADAVRLAGHSCPTVAGAYLMARCMLKHLYGDELPERGALAVEFRAQEEDGVAGVMASVFTLLTGAAGKGGFKGLAGRYGRRNLLHFGVADVRGEVRMVRLDTRTAVTASLDLSLVPADPAIGAVLGAALEAGDPAARSEFGHLWQRRVERLLREFADHPGLVRLS